MLLTWYILTAFTYTFLLVLSDSRRFYMTVVLASVMSIILVMLSLWGGLLYFWYFGDI